MQMRAPAGPGQPGSATAALDIYPGLSVASSRRYLRMTHYSSLTTARRALIMCALVAACSCLCVARASAATLIAANGNLAAFSAYGTKGGTLRTVGGGYGGDASAFSARVSGGSDLDYARGRLNVSWPQGSQVMWGAAFDIPTRFHTASHGNVTVMRWDNYSAGSRQWDEDLLEVSLSSNMASLIHLTVNGSQVTQTTLVGPFALPLGSWFTLQVKQTLSSGSGATSQVFVGGKLVGSSGGANLTGAAVTSVRYGLVVVSDGAEQGRTALHFDQATASQTASQAPISPPTAQSGTVLSALIATANAITAADYPYVYGGGHQHAGTAGIGLPGGTGYDGHTVGFDCSGSVAAVLAGGSLWQPGAPVPSDAGVIDELSAQHLIVPGQGTGSEEVTLFDDYGVHIFMRIDGRYFGTSDGGGGNGSQPNGGAGWLDDGAPDASSPSYTAYHFPLAELTAAYSPQVALRIGAKPSR
jgi:hypothetical protein